MDPEIFYPEGGYLFDESLFGPSGDRGDKTDAVDAGQKGVDLQRIDVMREIAGGHFVRGVHEGGDAVEALQIGVHPRVEALQAFLGDPVKGPFGGEIIAAIAVEKHPKGDGETSEKQYKFGSPHQL